MVRYQHRVTLAVPLPPLSHHGAHLLVAPCDQGVFPHSPCARVASLTAQRVDGQRAVLRGAAGALVPWEHPGREDLVVGDYVVNNNDNIDQLRELIHAAARFTTGVCLR